MNKFAQQITELWQRSPGPVRGLCEPGTGRTSSACSGMRCWLDGSWQPAAYCGCAWQNKEANGMLAHWSPETIFQEFYVYPALFSRRKFGLWQVRRWEAIKGTGNGSALASCHESRVIVVIIKLLFVDYYLCAHELCFTCLIPLGPHYKPLNWALWF